MEVNETLQNNIEVHIEDQNDIYDVSQKQNTHGNHWNPKPKTVYGGKESLIVYAPPGLFKKA